MNRIQHSRNLRGLCVAWCNKLENRAISCSRGRHYGRRYDEEYFWILATSKRDLSTTTCDTCRIKCVWPEILRSYVRPNIIDVEACDFTEDCASRFRDDFSRCYMKAVNFPFTLKGEKILTMLTDGVGDRCRRMKISTVTLRECRSAPLTLRMCGDEDRKHGQISNTDIFCPIHLHRKFER